MPKPPRACRQTHLMRFSVITAPYSLPSRCRPESETGPVLPGIPLPGRLDTCFHPNDGYFDDTPLIDELPRPPPAGYRAGGSVSSLRPSPPK